MHVGRTIGRYLAGVVVLALVIAGGITARIVQFAHTDSAAPSDAIIVLGAAQYNGRPSPVFRARLDHAADLYRRGLADHILTIGGRQAGDRTTEGQAGRHYLESAGVPKAALIAVPTGDDTLVSLRAANVVMDEHGWTSVILVSDPWHLQRSRMMARDLGLQVRVSPVTTGPATDRAVEPRYIARELIGTLFYRLVGGSSGSGSAVL